MPFTVHDCVVSNDVTFRSFALVELAWELSCIPWELPRIPRYNLCQVCKETGCLHLTVCVSAWQDRYSLCWSTTDSTAGVVCEHGHHACGRVRLSKRMMSSPISLSLGVRYQSYGDSMSMEDVQASTMGAADVRASKTGSAQRGGTSRGERGGTSRGAVMALSKEGAPRCVECESTAGACVFGWVELLRV